MHVASETFVVVPSGGGGLASHKTAGFPGSAPKTGRTIVQSEWRPLRGMQAMPVQRDCEDGDTRSFTTRNRRMSLVNAFVRFRGIHVECHPSALACIVFSLVRTV
jgi:hypothetical protein